MERVRPGSVARRPRLCEAYVGCGSGPSNTPGKVMEIRYFLSEALVSPLLDVLAEALSPEKHLRE